MRKLSLTTKDLHIQERAMNLILIQIFQKHLRTLFQS